MKNYDIVFLGHMAVDEVHHFGGEVTVNAGSAVLCGALAAARVGRRVAVVTRMAPWDEQMLNGLVASGVEVIPIPAKATTYMQVFHQSANMDERSIIQKASAGFFHAAEVPSMSAGVVHLAGITDQEFDLALMRNLRARGWRLSADMQGFVRQVQSGTGEVVFRDVPSKQEMAALLDYVKLDVVEAEILTGTRDLEPAARQFAAWGAGEVLITRADGVFALVDGQPYFSPFSNRSVIGRTGRGDTTFGAYLAWRPGHTVQQALDFASALVSIKMESIGPFNGKLEDVLQRMQAVAGK